jgi:hypothetical protein
MNQSNPVIQALNICKAFSKVLNEKIEEGFTEILSEWGKFEAEQKENLRQFAQEVKEKAKREADNSNSTGNSSVNFDDKEDLQEILDELRSEIARLRAELKNHRAYI